MLVAFHVNNGSLTTKKRLNKPLSKGDKMRRSFKIVFGIVFIISAILFFGLKLFWPKDWVVNAPVIQFLTGIGEGKITLGQLQQKITLPPGFQINIYADHLGHARALHLLPNGDLLLSTPRSGEVKVLRADHNGDGQADEVHTIINHLNEPHGLAYKNGQLYIAETDAIVRVAYNLKSASADLSTLTRIVRGLPGGGNHWSRSLKFGPDGFLYLSIGSSCNACIEKDKRRAALMRFKPDGSEGILFATGLRNTVGFDWQPFTGDLYGVDNGRDLLGDDVPPDELNKIVMDGFYGWPYLYGDNVPDPSYGQSNDPRIKNAIKPTYKMTAHMAPLAITFLTSPKTPPNYRNAALVTLHGSWNRSKKSGYKIISLHWQKDGSIIERPFATGFMVNEEVFGRPVDIIQAPDGTIYASDDFTNSVYRIAQPARTEN
jgi:glucose/arabinose dehydrogenase